MYQAVTRLAQLLGYRLLKTGLIEAGELLVGGTPQHSIQHLLATSTIAYTAFGRDVNTVPEGYGIRRCPWIQAMVPSDATACDGLR